MNMNSEYECTENAFRKSPVWACWFILYIECHFSYEANFQTLWELP